MAWAAGKHRSWAVVSVLALAAVLRGCTGGGDGGGGVSPAADVLSDLLQSVWPEVVKPELDEAQSEAEALLTAVEAWAEAEGSGGDTAGTRAAAQQAWHELMFAWERIEPMQIGPAASSISAVGGLDLRDEIYSWPTVNPCRVDQETVEEAWDDLDFFEVELVNVYGLDALETLLFSGEGNACPSQVAINAEGTWDALGADGVAQNRADYAVAVATHLLDDLAALRQEWLPEGDDFGGQVASAGEPGSLYESQEQALNAVFDALFYVETRTKDRKLGGPLGLWDCGSDSCLSDVETTQAGGSNTWISANLQGFRALYTGGPGTGMDDLLRELGHDDVADAMVQRLSEAEAAAADLTVGIDEAVTSDPAPAQDLYDALKGVTDLLKGDVVTLLALQIPSEAAGDND